MADDIYRSIKDLPWEKMGEQAKNVLSIVSPVVNFNKGTLRRDDEFDIKASVVDLTTTKRDQYWEDNQDFFTKLPFPIFNLTGSTTALEVPYFQIQGTLELNKYDANNDMQVTQNQAKVSVPMSTDLAMLHGHHWDCSYGPFPKSMRFGSPHLDHPFPKTAAIFAMTELAWELGFLD